MAESFNTPASTDVIALKMKTMLACATKYHSCSNGGNVRKLKVPEKHKEEAEVQLKPFSTSALGGGGWSAPRPYRFTPRKETHYPLYRRPGGPQNRSE
jgi:hypothetical protein